jgi:HSP20 family molecular chaperone IbpA
MWAEACAMIERTDRLHRQFFRPTFAPAQPANWEPPVDVFETQAGLLIVAALPGVEPSDLDVSIDQGVVRIGGLRRLPPLLPGATIRRLEIPHGRFERSVRLPAGVFEVEQSALAHGCLVLSLSKLR